MQSWWRELVSCLMTWDGRGREGTGGTHQVRAFDDGAGVGRGESVETAEALVEGGFGWFRGRGLRWVLGNGCLFEWDCVGHVDVAVWVPGFDVWMDVVG
jgi:hypothetical protein